MNKKMLFVCSLLLLGTQLAVADPTRPAPGWQISQNVGSKVAPSVPKLQLIKQTSSGRIAVIEGQQLQQGQRFADYLVRKIEQDRVILDLNGEQLILPLHNTAIKQYE
ncbi:MAG TPA: hypothetical protein VLA40_15130 [Rheinheimera sp.]|nr:hypothetical protein [Rheinheimera sp.]